MDSQGLLGLYRSTLSSEEVTVACVSTDEHVQGEGVRDAAEESQLNAFWLIEWWNVQVSFDNGS